MSCTCTTLNRVRVRAHPRRVARGVTCAVSEHNRARRPKVSPDAWRDTPTGSAKYQAAYAEAQRKADETGFDYGLEANDLFKSYSVFMLPGKKYRTGHELRCQVVHPTHLDKTQPGHGPMA